MGFFNFLKRRSAPSQQRPSTTAESVEQIRTRARRRLIGSVVLVVAAVAVFPLLFDAQPRPVSADIPIEIPDKDTASAIPAPAAVTEGDQRNLQAAGAEDGLSDGEQILPPADDHQAAAAPAPVPAPKVASATPVPAAPRTVPEPAKAAPSIAPAVPVEPTPARTQAPKAAAEPPKAKPDARVAEVKPKPETKPRPEPKPEAASAGTTNNAKPPADKKPAPKPAPSSASVASSNDAARAMALLEGRSPPASSNAVASDASSSKPAASSERLLIQVGAFADASKANEVKARLAAAGVSAYTQELKTSAGVRVRVRSGPYSGRSAADAAASKIRALGLQAAVIPG